MTRLSSTHQMIQEAVRNFVQAQITPFAAQWDRDHHFPKEVHQGLAELGCYGLCVPQAYGGAELDYLSLAIVLEEIAAGDGGTSTAISVTNCPVNAILMKYGDSAQKQQWLTPLAQGKMLGAFALTEPNVGSDAASIQTTAKRDANGYVLHGVKQFITSGQNGHVAIVIAKTNPSAGKKGMSAFLVPTHIAGYHVTHLEAKCGQHSSDTAQITLDQCRIPLDHLIGQEGEGYKIALSALEGGRIGIAAQSVGMARAALSIAITYAKERISFGKPIIEHQAIAFRLAEMSTQIEAARALVYQAAQLRDEGLPCLKEAAMAKLFASEMAEIVCSKAMQILGGYGYVQDFPLERIWRDVRVCQIYEGTSDVQKMLIARHF